MPAARSLALCCWAIFLVSWHFITLCLRASSCSHFPFHAGNHGLSSSVSCMPAIMWRNWSVSWLHMDTQLEVICAPAVTLVSNTWMVRIAIAVSLTHTPEWVANNPYNNNQAWARVCPLVSSWALLKAAREGAEPPVTNAQILIHVFIIF